MSALGEQGAFQAKKAADGHPGEDRVTACRGGGRRGEETSGASGGTVAVTKDRGEISCRIFVYSLVSSLFTCSVCMINAERVETVSVGCSYGWTSRRMRASMG